VRQLAFAEARHETPLVSLVQSAFFHPLVGTLLQVGREGLINLFFILEHQADSARPCLRAVVDVDDRCGELERGGREVQAHEQGYLASPLELVLSGDENAAVTKLPFMGQLEVGWRGVTDLHSRARFDQHLSEQLVRQKKANTESALVD